MKNVIKQLLEISSGRYEDMVINHYHQWCLHQSHDDVDLQKLLANRSLFSWWYGQYNELEVQFAKRAIDFFGKATTEIMEEYHAEHMIKMKHFFSPPLISRARNQQPITPQYN